MPRHADRRILRRCACWRGCCPQGYLHDGHLSLIAAAKWVLIWDASRRHRCQAHTHAGPPSTPAWQRTSALGSWHAESQLACAACECRAATRMLDSWHADRRRGCRAVLLQGARGCRRGVHLRQPYPGAAGLALGSVRVQTYLRVFRARPRTLYRLSGSWRTPCQRGAASAAERGPGTTPLQRCFLRRDPAPQFSANEDFDVYPRNPVRPRWRPALSIGRAVPQRVLHGACWVLLWFEPRAPPANGQQRRGLGCSAAAPAGEAKAAAGVDQCLFGSSLRVLPANPGRSAAANAAASNP